MDIGRGGLFSIFFLLAAFGCIMLWRDVVRASARRSKSMAPGTEGFVVAWGEAPSKALDVEVERTKRLAIYGCFFFVVASLTAAWVVPWALVFGDSTLGRHGQSPGAGLVQIGIFIGFAALAALYAWRQGALAYALNGSAGSVAARDEELTMQPLGRRVEKASGETFASRRDGDCP